MQKSSWYMRWFLFAAILVNSGMLFVPGAALSVSVNGQQSAAESNVTQPLAATSTMSSTFPSRSYLFIHDTRRYQLVFKLFGHAKKKTILFNNTDSIFSGKPPEELLNIYNYFVNPSTPLRTKYIIFEFLENFISSHKSYTQQSM